MKRISFEVHSESRILGLLLVLLVCGSVVLVALGLWLLFAMAILAAAIIAGARALLSWRLGKPTPRAVKRLRTTQPGEPRDDV